MKKIKRIVVFGIIGCFVVLAVLVYIFTTKQDNTLEFMVIDKISKGWVWDLSITLQNRIIKGYYQSDNGPLPFRFTHLVPGTFDMTLSAPSYNPVTVSVKIKNHRNVLAEPIVMEGYEIPEFDNFFIFSEPQGGDVLFELRPANKQNYAVVNHPCMDIWIGCKLYTQVMNGMNVTAPTETGSETGALVFSGRIPWEWINAPDNIFRYKARLKGSLIQKNNAPYWVAEFVIIIPKLGKITNAELEELILPLLELEDRQEVDKVLKNYTDKFIYCLDECWNIEALK